MAPVDGTRRTGADHHCLADLSPRARLWSREGQLQRVQGQDIFVHRTDGRPPLMLFLHGFPSSSYDWQPVVAQLGHHATLALDFLGFGLSAKPPDASYSLMTQADIVEELVGREDRQPVVIVAHDMGTSVANELMARDREGSLGFPLRSVLLFNGSMIVELASLTWAQKLLRSPLGPLAARYSNRRLFQRQFARLFSRAHPLSRSDANDQWLLWSNRDGNRLAHLLAGYIGERRRYAERWHGAIAGWPGRLHLAWGLQDPVATTAVLTGLRQLRPSAPVTEYPDLGHYPQIEYPNAIVGAITRLLDEVVP